MVKDPRAGRVKTRLGRDIGMVPAAWWFRHQVAALLRRLDDPRWDLVLAVAPDGAIRSRAFPAQLPRLPQGRGDLGARMARLLRRSGPGPVCLIGGDIPGVNAPHITRAFCALRRTGVVFGPATDGGFWLIGLHHGGLAPRGLFSGVRWSSEHALGDSLATLGGRRFALVDRLADVDRAVDLPQGIALR